MTRFVAFLRAINVGGHVVKMDALRGLFSELGLTRVETYIASGNVLFDTAARNAGALEARIVKHLRRELGYDVATFLRTAAEVGGIATYRPFPEVAGASLYIGFLAAPLRDDAVGKVKAFATPVDELHVHGREIYWSCRIRSSDSDFSLARLERALGVQATFRNATTVRKIAALMGGA